MGPTCLLLLFSVCFSSEIIYFIPVSVPSILNENSLTILHFSGFSLKFSFCGVYLMPIALNFVKIKLSQNSTKFDWVIKFRETNSTVKSVSSSEI